MTYSDSLCRCYPNALPGLPRRNKTNCPKHGGQVAYRLRDGQIRPEYEGAVLLKELDPERITIDLETEYEQP